MKQIEIRNAVQDRLDVLTYRILDEFHPGEEDAWAGTIALNGAAVPFAVVHEDREVRTRREVIRSLLEAALNQLDRWEE